MFRRPSVALYDGKKYRLLAVEDIIYLQAEGSYTNIQLVGDEKLVLSRNLKAIAKNLPTEEFIRIHHSHVINLLHTTAYENGNSNMLHMSNGQVLSVSRAKRKELLERFVMV